MDNLTGKCGACFWWHEDEGQARNVDDGVGVSGVCCIDPQAYVRSQRLKACSRYTGKDAPAARVGPVDHARMLYLSQRVKDGFALTPEERGDFARIEALEGHGRVGKITYATVDVPPDPKLTAAETVEIPNPQTMTIVDCKAGNSAGCGVVMADGKVVEGAGIPGIPELADVPMTVADAQSVVDAAATKSAHEPQVATIKPGDEVEVNAKGVVMAHKSGKGFEVRQYDPMKDRTALLKKRLLDALIEKSDTIPGELLDTIHKVFVCP